MKRLILTIVIVVVVLISFETVAQARNPVLARRSRVQESMRRARIYGSYGGGYRNPVLARRSRVQESLRRARIYGSYGSPVVLPRHIGRNDFSIEIVATRNFISIGGSVLIGR